MNIMPGEVDHIINGNDNLKMTGKTIMLVFGTRPEAIKICLF